MGGRAAIGALVVAAAAAAACGGEAFVGYRGTVTAGDATGYSFDAGPEIGARPVAGAEVTLRLCAGACSGDESVLRTTTDAVGAWGTLDAVFGAGFDDHEIQIEVTAPGYERFVYSTVYEDTDDPTGGDRYLNVRLERS